MQSSNFQIILRIITFADVIDNEHTRYSGKNEPHALTTVAELSGEDCLEEVGDLAKV